MGNRASRQEGAPSGFNVRFTPAVLEKAGATGGAEGAAPAAPTNEALQQAFQQGIEHAQQQLAQQLAAQEAEARAQQLEAMQDANAESDRILRERIEALQRREYRAPVKPLGCKEEREAALACYREVRGKGSGEIVTTCQQAADDLEKCAALIREAAMVKIVKGSLKS